MLEVQAPLAKLILDPTRSPNSACANLLITVESFTLIKNYLGKLTKRQLKMTLRLLFLRFFSISLAFHIQKLHFFPLQKTFLFFCWEYKVNGTVVATKIKRFNQHFSTHFSESINYTSSGLEASFFLCFICIMCCLKSFLV